jgi:hypothetical protein
MLPDVWANDWANISFVTSSVRVTVLAVLSIRVSLSFCSLGYLPVILKLKNGKVYPRLEVHIGCFAFFTLHVSRLFFSCSSSIPYVKLIAIVMGNWPLNYSCYYVYCQIHKAKGSALLPYSVFLLCAVFWQHHYIS